MKQKTKEILSIVLRVINHILHQLVLSKKQRDSHPEPSCPEHVEGSEGSENGNKA